MWQIGNEGGFLAAPVTMTVLNDGQLLMCPAERADVIVDFTDVSSGGHVLGDVGSDEPYNGLVQDPADPNTAGQMMQFRIGPTLTPDTTTPAQFLVLSAITPVPALPSHGRWRCSK